MFGYHYLIFNLFSFLVFLSPQNEVQSDAFSQVSFEVVISTEHRQSPAVIELAVALNEIIELSHTIKLPSADPFYQIQETLYSSYESKLLYFQIGNAIDLELTRTSIIFPFHCFT